MSYIALTTIGVKIGYAVEVASGGLTDHPTVPKTGWKRIKGLKSTPDFNQSPSTADVSTFENIEYTSKVGLLSEAPDSMEFNAVLSQGFADDWEKMLTEYNTNAKAANKRMWYVIEIPGFDQAQYFSGIPDEIKFPAMDVNTAIDNFAVHITPDGGESFVDDKPLEDGGWSDGE